MQNSALEPLFRRRGGLPFEQFPPCEEHPHQRAHDRVDQKHGPMGQKRQIQKHLSDQGECTTGRSL